MQFNLDQKNIIAKFFWWPTFVRLILQRQILEQCDQIWQNFAKVAKIKKSWAIFGGFMCKFGKKINLFWQMYVIFIAVGRNKY